MPNAIGHVVLNSPERFLGEVTRRCEVSVEGVPVKLEKPFLLKLHLPEKQTKQVWIPANHVSERIFVIPAIKKFGNLRSDIRYLCRAKGFEDTYVQIVLEFERNSLRVVGVLVRPGLYQFEIADDNIETVVGNSDDQKLIQISVVRDDAKVREGATQGKVGK